MPDSKLTLVGSQIKSTELHQFAPLQGVWPQTDATSHAWSRGNRSAGVDEWAVWEVIRSGRASGGSWNESSRREELRGVTAGPGGTGCVWGYGQEYKYNNDYGQECNNEVKGPVHLSLYNST